MVDDDLPAPCLLDETWLPVEALAQACRVEADWLLARLEDGYVPHAECVAGVWRLSVASIKRVRCLRRVERDFDAVPELAALVADLIDEIDDLRGRLRRCGGR